MKIILNGRKVGNGDSACYFENKAYLKKRGLKKRKLTTIQEFSRFETKAEVQLLENTFI